MRTIFLGDSLTQGMPGVSYWRFLSNKTNFINKGLGGDTLIGASKRLEKILGQEKYRSVDRFVLEIGINDILLPYLKSHFPLWRFTVWLKGNLLGCVPTPDLQTFQLRYEALLTRLTAEKKTIVVIGLPLIENNDLPLNDMALEYNEAIRTLCEQFKLPYLNLGHLEQEIKKENGGSYFFGRRNLGNVIDTILTSFLPFSMAVAKKRSLAVTVDGVHLNEKTARILAKSLEDHYL